MALLRALITQPVQALTVLATQFIPIIKGFNDVHARFEFGHHRHLPALADFFLGRLVDVTQVSRDNRGLPVQAFEAVMQARFEQITLWYMGRSSPTD